MPTGRFSRWALASLPGYPVIRGAWASSVCLSDGFRASVGELHLRGRPQPWPRRSYDPRGVLVIGRLYSSFASQLIISIQKLANKLLIGLRKNINLLIGDFVMRNRTTIAFDGSIGVENQAIVSPPFVGKVEFVFSVNQRPLDSFHGLINTKPLRLFKKKLNLFLMAQKARLDNPDNDGMGVEPIPRGKAELLGLLPGPYLSNAHKAMMTPLKIPSIKPIKPLVS